jgi:hypothetical protein
VLLLLLLMLLLVACAAGQPASPGPGSPTLAPALAPIPPTPPPIVAPSPTRLPQPSPPPPPTATPVSELPLRIEALLDPPTPRAGEEFVLALSITNDGDRPAHGVYIATTGPWDRWTVLGVEPAGSVSQDADGWHIASDEEIPAGETRTILVHLRADEPSQEQLTFAVREAEPSDLP